MIKAPLPNNSIEYVTIGHNWNIKLQYVGYQKQLDITQKFNLKNLDFSTNGH